MLSSVVFPAPVPPEIRTFNRARTMPCTSSNIAGVRVSMRSRSSPDSASRLNFRMERCGPSMARGGMIALTRDPSGKRASTMGEESSMRRPTAETMRSITCSRCLSFWKRTSVGSSLPWRSTYTCL